MNAEEMTMNVQGMTCQGCAGTVTDAAAGVPGVADARVDLEGKTLTVATDGSSPAVAVRAAVSVAVAESGYEVEEDEFQ